MATFVAHAEYELHVPLYIGGGSNFQVGGGADH